MLVTIRDKRSVSLLGRQRRKTHHLDKHTLRETRCPQRSPSGQSFDIKTSLIAATA